MQDVLALLQTQLEPYAIQVELVRPGHVVLRGNPGSAAAVQPQQLLAWLDAKLGSMPLTIEFLCPDDPSLAWQQRLEWRYLLPASVATESAPLVAPPTRTDRFLVCGLGRLGRYCVQALGRFGGAVTAIDLQALPQDDLDELSCLIAPPWVGDCRLERVLRAAGVNECRAILVLTDDDGINLATALAAQKLNPHIRLVVRSSKQNLNQLLQQRLNNFVAYDPNELPATAFTLAALGAETLGLFSIDGVPLRIIQRRVRPNEIYDRYVAGGLHKRHIRLLDCADHPETRDRLFHQWHPEHIIRAGEEIVYVEQVHDARPSEPTTQWWQPLLLAWLYVSQHSLAELKQDVWLWVQANQLRQSMVIAAAVSTLLGMCTTLALRYNVAITWQEAINATIVLLLGGYGDVFEGLQRDLPIPSWVLALCLMTTLMSLIFVLGVLGLLADQVVSTRFFFLQQRARLPRQDHVVVFGLGRIGKKIAAFLQQQQQPLVIVTENPDHAALFPQLPMITGSYLDAIAKVNLETAKSAVLVTDDQLLNLELALMAQERLRDNHLTLVVRTQDREFGDSLARLLPDAQGLCAYALSAEAFAGAAFGEQILGLFRLRDRTVMVVEYQIDAIDTLHHKLLAQVSYGYGVVPLMHQRAQIKHWLPLDDERLLSGDRLVVLATADGLKRIELGQLEPPPVWRLSMLKPLNGSVLFEAAGILHRITGCELQDARAFLLALPGDIELKMYEHQAARLWQQLRSMKSLPVKLERLDGTGGDRSERLSAAAPDPDPASETLH